MRLNIKHPFLYLCWAIVTVTLGSLLWKPYLSLEAKLVILLFSGAFLYFFVSVLDFLEKLDEQVWQAKSGFK